LYETAGTYSFVCGGEESYGFLMGSFVRDKDAVIGCLLACEMLAYYKSKGCHLSRVLDEIFIRHGVYYESLVTFTMPGQQGAQDIKAIMQTLRVSPPKALGGRFTLTSVKDFQSGNETLPLSDVLQFISHDGSLVSIRPSGTEPKIKLYFSVHEPVTHADQLSQIKERTKKKLKDLETATLAMF
jgi:phosphoglucomutase